MTTNKNIKLDATGGASLTGVPVPSPQQQLYVLDSNGTPEISPLDINQGNVTGDCFLLAPIGELAMLDPAAIENMDGLNANGTYTVKLDQSATAFSTTLLPVEMTVNPANFSPGAATPNIVNGKAIIWPEVIEEADAELNGGYASISNGGYSVQAMEQLTGQQAYSVSTGNLTLSFLQSLAGKDLVTFDSLDNADLPNAIVPDHSYMFDGFKTIFGQPYVCLLNPWGEGSGAEPPPIPFSDLASDFSEIDYCLPPQGSAVTGSYIQLQFPLITNLASGGSEIETLSPTADIATESRAFSGPNLTGNETDTINWVAGGSQIIFLTPSAGILSQYSNYTGAYGEGTLIDTVYNYNTGISMEERIAPSIGIVDEFDYFSGANMTGKETEIIRNLSNGDSEVISSFNPSPKIAAEGTIFSQANGFGINIGKVYALQPGQDGTFNSANDIYYATSNTVLSVIGVGNTVTLSGSANSVSIGGQNETISAQGTGNTIVASETASISINGSLNNVTAGIGSTVGVSNTPEPQGANEINLSQGTINVAVGATEIIGNSDTVNSNSILNIINMYGSFNTTLESGALDSMAETGNDNIITIGSTALSDNVTVNGLLDNIFESGRQNTISATGFADQINLGKNTILDNIAVSGYFNNVVDQGSLNNITYEGNVGSLTTTGLQDKIAVSGSQNTLVISNATVKLSSGSANDLITGSKDIVNAQSNIGLVAELSSSTLNISNSSLTLYGADSGDSLKGDNNKITLTAGGTVAINGTGNIINAAQGDIIDVTGAHNTIKFDAAAGEVTTATLKDLQPTDNIVITGHSLNCTTRMSFANGNLSLSDSGGVYADIAVSDAFNAFKIVPDAAGGERIAPFTCTELPASVSLNDLASGFNSFSKFAPHAGGLMASHYQDVARDMVAFSPARGVGMLNPASPPLTAISPNSYQFQCG